MVSHGRPAMKPMPKIGDLWVGESPTSLGRVIFILSHEETRQYGWHVLILHSPNLDIKLPCRWNMSLDEFKSFQKIASAE